MAFKAFDPKNPDKPMEVKLSSGKLFTISCQNPRCGFEQGMAIVSKATQPDGPFDRPILGSEPCIQCNSETQWREIGFLDGDDAEQIAQEN